MRSDRGKPPERKAARRLPSLLTEEEAAKYLRVSVRTVQGWWLRGGGPPFLRIGRLVRYRSSALEGWLDVRELRSTSEESALQQKRR